MRQDASVWFGTAPKYLFSEKLEGDTAPNQLTYQLLKCYVSYLLENNWDKVRTLPTFILSLGERDLEQTLKLVLDVEMDKNRN